MNIVVVGYKGKMGGAVFSELKQKYNVVGIDKDDDIKNIKLADLVIDFGGAESSVLSARWCNDKNVKLIIGSTGQTKNQLNEINLISKNIPILLSQNFSLGILCVSNMLSVFSENEIESITIIEKHHKNKKDKPSGTALMLKEFIKNNLNISAEILSVRGGEEVGTHEICLYLKNEKIILSHQAFSCDAFVAGVMLAVEKMKNVTQCGLYNFKKIMVFNY